VKYIVAFGRFWWDFIVGDDWTVAAGVAVTLGAVGVLAHENINAWWLLPLAIALLTAISVWRQASSSSDDAPAEPG
jgi:apolipoprotein N-acyltransferase